MTKYTNEKKEHALSQMSAPHNKPVAAVAQLTGVPEATLYLWRKPAFHLTRWAAQAGMTPNMVTAIGAVGSPASTTGQVLCPGDRVLALEGRAIERYDDIGPLLQDLARNGQPVRVRVASPGRPRAEPARARARSSMARATPTSASRTACWAASPR